MHSISLSKHIPLWLGIVGVNMGLIVMFGALGIAPMKSSIYIGLFFLLFTLIPIHFKKLSRYRRDFGIVSGIFILLHGAIAFNSVLNANIANALQQSILPGYIGSLIFFSLLITSNFFIQRKLGVRWRAIHALVWFALPLSLLHTVKASEAYTGEVALLGTALLGGLILFGFLKPFFAPGVRREHLRDAVLIAFGVVVSAAMVWVYIFLRS